MTLGLHTDMVLPLARLASTVNSAQSSVYSPQTLKSFILTRRRLPRLSEIVPTRWILTLMFCSTFREISADSSLVPELHAPRSREETVDETSGMNNREFFARQLPTDPERDLEATNRESFPRTRQISLCESYPELCSAGARHTSVSC